MSPLRWLAVTQGSSDPKLSLDDLDRAPQTLPVQSDFDFRSAYHSLHDRFVETADENFALKEEVGRLRIYNGTRQLLDELIKPFAERAFWFMCSYCGFAAVVLVAHGFHILNFNLPDQVLGYLVGSTAVTVIGLVGMVLTGVFVGSRPK